MSITPPPIDYVQCFCRKKTVVAVTHYKKGRVLIKIKRIYHGLGKRSIRVVQFDTTKNRFLVAGDEFLIKYWDMDNVSILTTTDVEGGLPVMV